MSNSWVSFATEKDFWPFHIIELFILMWAPRAPPHVKCTKKYLMSCSRVNEGFKLLNFCTQKTIFSVTPCKLLRCSQARRALVLSCDWGRVKDVQVTYFKEHSHTYNKVLQFPRHKSPTRVHNPCWRISTNATEIFAFLDIVKVLMLF